MLAQDLRELRMVELMTLVVWANHLVPALAHLFDGEWSVLEDGVSQIVRFAPLPNWCGLIRLELELFD